VWFREDGLSAPINNTIAFIWKQIALSFPCIGGVAFDNGSWGATGQETRVCRIVKIFELACPPKVTLLSSSALRLVFHPTITHTQHQ
jgi:hypothetical protein